MFMHICLHLNDVIIPWESKNQADFVDQSLFGFWDTIRVFRGLMDFLAFLVQKLWQNKRKLIREIPVNYSAYSSITWGVLAITWAPETPGSRSTSLKILIPASNPTKL